MSRQELVTRKELDQVWKHIETFNREMGEVCERVAHIETNITWIKWLSLTILSSSLMLVLKTLLGLTI